MNLENIKSTKSKAISIVKFAKKNKKLKLLSVASGVGEAWLYKVASGKCNPSLERCLMVIENKNVINSKNTCVCKKTEAA